ncbi:MAG: rhomboid family intramembrane serine protease [Patescibacteria group bacterium]
MNSTYFLIVINCAIYALPFLIKIEGPTSDSFVNFLSLFWQEKSKIDQGEVYRLFTAMFLHGNLLHLFMNMYTLWSLETNSNYMHKMIGGKRSKINNDVLFMLVYITTGLCGNVLSMYHTGSPSVGASGAILGIFGFFCAFAIQSRNKPAIISMLISIAITFAIGLSIPRIDNWAHGGGLVSGFVLFFILNLFF